MRVGVLAPMPSELRPVVKRLGLRAGPGGRAVGRRGSVEIVAARAGMGTRAAGDAARRLLDAAAPDHVVVVGVAGGIAEGQEIGDVLAVDVVIDGATGTTYRPHPLGPSGALAGGPTAGGAPAGGRAASGGPAGGGPASGGALRTADDFLTDPDRIAALRSAGVVALDMETAAVAAACEERGCPWSVVRAVSDRFDDGLVDGAVFALARPDGSPDPAAVARLLVRHPGRIADLVRLGRDLRTATRAAAAALAATLDACG